MRYTAVMDETPTNDHARLEQKIDAIYESVEKTRRYFQITLWVTIAVVVLPLIAMVFVIPAVLSTYLAPFDGLL